MCNRHLKFNMFKTKILIFYPLLSLPKESPKRKNTPLLGVFSFPINGYFPAAQSPESALTPLSPTSHIIFIRKSCWLFFRNPLAPHHLHSGSLVQHHHLLGQHQCPDWAPCFFPCLSAGYVHPNSLHDLTSRYNVDGANLVSIQPPQ